VPGRARRPRSAPASAAGFAAALVLLLLLPAGGRASSAAVAIGSDGSVVVDLSTEILNGATIREAMDGNFTPIVDAITSNATQRAEILAEIAAAESTPVLGALFGNRDGIVEPIEVTNFESLLQYEAQLLPLGGISGGSLLAFTLDGARSTSTKISDIVFTNATGPADSTAPLGVTTAVTDTFPSSGTSHTLALTTNVSVGAFPITLLTGTIGLSVVTPAGTSITGTAGFAQVSIANNPWGWGTSSLSGSFEPTTSGVLSVSYGPSFPTGDLLVLGVPIVAAVVAVAAVLLHRRRARRRSESP